MTTPLPPFQIDYDYLTAATDGASEQYRLVSAATVQMCLAALDAMQFNRYWQASGGWLSDAKITSKNSMVDKAVHELLTAVELECTPDGLKDLKGGTGGICALYDDCEERMGNVIVHVGGVAYLVENCGCGDSNFYPLGKATTNLNPDGTTTIDKTPAPDGGDVPLVVGAEYQECYAAGAAAAMLHRAAEFHEMSIGLISTGVDVLSPFDEVLDIVAIASSFLSGEGNWSDWGEYLNDAVRDALTSESVVSQMTAAWSYEGEINAFQLVGWALKAPMFADAIPVKSMLLDWATFVSAGSVNADLRLIASACAGGAEYTPPGVIPPTPIVGDLVEGLNQYEHGGLTYPIMVYVAPFAHTAVDQVWVATDAPVNCLGLAAVGTVTGSYGGETSLRGADTPNNDTHQQWIDYTMDRPLWHVHTDIPYRDLIDAITGKTAVDGNLSTNRNESQPQIKMIGGDGAFACDYAIAIGAPS